MPKLKQINEVVRRPEDSVARDEPKRYFVCPVCHQAVDMSCLDELIYHNRRPHRPLEFGQ